MHLVLVLEVGLLMKRKKINYYFFISDKVISHSNPVCNALPSSSLVCSALQISFYRIFLLALVKQLISLNLDRDS